MDIRCWDTRVQSYPTSASKIESANCSDWPLLYFLFMAGGWNFYGTFRRPYTKSTFLFLKSWFVTEIQGFKVTSLLQVKSLVQQGKGGYQRKNALVGAQKRLICLKQKDWSKRWVLGTSNRCPDHFSRQILTTTPTFPYSSKNSSAEHIYDISTCLILTNTVNHIDKHTHTHTHTLTHSLSLSLSLSLKHKHTHTHTLSLSLSLSLSLTHTGTCIKSVNTFDWGIFGAVWKCGRGGQEFSAEVIRAPGGGSWYPAIRSIFML